VYGLNLAGQTAWPWYSRPLSKARMAAASVDKVTDSMGNRG